MCNLTVVECSSTNPPVELLPYIAWVIRPAQCPSISRAAPPRAIATAQGSYVCGILSVHIEGPLVECWSMNAACQLSFEHGLSWRFHLRRSCCELGFYELLAGGICQISTYIVRDIQTKRDRARAGVRAYKHVERLADTAAHATDAGQTCYCGSAHGIPHFSAVPLPISALLSIDYKPT